MMYWQPLLAIWFNRAWDFWNADSSIYLLFQVGSLETDPERGFMGKWFIEQCSQDSEKEAKWRCKASVTGSSTWEICRAWAPPTHLSLVKGYLRQRDKHFQALPALRAHRQSTFCRHEGSPPTKKRESGARSKSKLGAKGLWDGKGTWGDRAGHKQHLSAVSTTVTESALTVSRDRAGYCREARNLQTSPLSSVMNICSLDISKQALRFVISQVWLPGIMTVNIDELLGGIVTSGKFLSSQHIVLIMVTATTIIIIWLRLAWCSPPLSSLPGTQQGFTSQLPWI